MTKYTVTYRVWNGATYIQRRSAPFIVSSPSLVEAAKVAETIAPIGATVISLQLYEEPA